MLAALFDRSHKTRILKELLLRLRDYGGGFQHDDSARLNVGDVLIRRGERPERQSSPLLVGDQNGLWHDIYCTGWAKPVYGFCPNTGSARLRGLTATGCLNCVAVRNGRFPGDETGSPW